MSRCAAPVRPWVLVWPPLPAFLLYCFPPPGGRSGASRRGCGPPQAGPPGGVIKKGVQKMGQDQDERAALLQEIDAAILAAVRARIKDARELSIGDLKTLAGIVKDMGGSGAIQGGGALVVRFEGDAADYAE